MKTQPTDLDPDAFIDAIEDDGRRDAVRALDALVRRAAPHLERRMWGSFLGYGTYHYRYASGREGDWFPIGIANQKGHIGVYLCVADEGGYLAEANADRLGKVSCGRSCIRIKRLDRVNLDVLEELVGTAARWIAEGRFAQ